MHCSGRAAIEQVRGLSLDLRPALLDDLGLVPALRSHVGAIARRSDIEASFVVDEHIDRQDPEVETACYRIAQEAMNNVARHSGAMRVRVELARSAHAFWLIVADDGPGFDVTQAMARAAAGASLGLLGMRERPRAWGVGSISPHRPVAEPRSGQLSPCGRRLSNRRAVA